MFLTNIVFIEKKWNKNLDCLFIRDFFNYYINLGKKGGGPYIFKILLNHLYLVKLLTVCQLSLKLWLNKHIFNTNPLNNGQEVVLSWKPFFLNTHFQLNMQTLKNKHLQAMLFLVVFLNLVTFWIAQVSSLAMLFFLFTDDTKPCLCWNMFIYTPSTYEPWMTVRKRK